VTTAAPVTEIEVEREDDTEVLSPTTSHQSLHSFHITCRSHAELSFTVDYSLMPPTLLANVRFMSCGCNSVELTWNVFACTYVHCVSL
jgi:hypothetical protein